MRKFFDFSNKKVGRWSVVGVIHPTKQGEERLWELICDCGTSKTLSSSSLRNSRSCGCLTKDVQRNLRTGKPSPRRGEYGDSSLNQLVSRYKRRAKEKEIPFNLSKEDVAKITKMNCTYCDSPPSSIMNTKETYGEYVYNGLDRIDSRKGYTTDNVVACCTRCNQAKNNQTLGEFYKWILKVYGRKDSWWPVYKDTI